MSAGAGWGGAVFYADCESECVQGKKVLGSYLIGATGPGVGFALPFELSAWDLEDSQATPDAANLEGPFALRGCSITPIIGFSYTDVRQGLGVGNFSFAPTAGFGANCYALGGASKLLNKQEGCCGGEPTIGASP